MTGRLPDFLIIGAFKSGTTSLTHYLGQHPRIFLPWLQEPAFFSSPRYDPEPGGPAEPVKPPESVYGRPRTESRAQYTALFERAPEDALCGECSPQYMTFPDSVGRIAEMLPHVKLIALLREPASRAYSDYSSFVRDGLEKASFADVVARTPSIRPPGHFVETGRYGKQLAPYFQVFPREQIKVITTEELRSDAERTMRDLFAWLGLDPDVQIDPSQQRNISGVPSSQALALAYQARRRLQPLLKPWLPRALVDAADARMAGGLRRVPADQEVMAELRAFYADDVDLLARLTGKDLSTW